MKDGISKVKSEIKGVMGIMQGNISKVLDRGAKLEDLQDKSGKYRLKAKMRLTENQWFSLNRTES